MLECQTVRGDVLADSTAGGVQGLGAGGVGEAPPGGRA